MFQITNLLYYKSYSDLKIYNEERWQYLPNRDGYKFFLIVKKQKKNYYIQLDKLEDTQNEGPGPVDQSKELLDPTEITLIIREERKSLLGINNRRKT